VAAVAKSEVQVAKPAGVLLQAVQVVPPTTAPNPLEQRVQTVSEQVKQFAPQSVQTLEAKY